MECFYPMLICAYRLQNTVSETLTQNLIIIYL